MIRVLEDGPGYRTTGGISGESPEGIAEANDQHHVKHYVTLSTPIWLRVRSD